MPSLIEYVDGNSGAVIQRLPVSEVPPSGREVYLRAGVMVSDRREADQVIAIARVVRWLVDEAGEPAEGDRATRAIVREYDAQGVLRRETLQVRQD